MEPKLYIQREHWVLHGELGVYRSGCKKAQISKILLEMESIRSQLSKTVLRNVPRRANRKIHIIPFWSQKGIKIEILLMQIHFLENMSPQLSKTVPRMFIRPLNQIL